MSIDWGKEAKAYWDEQPHPRAPSLKIGEFATAVKLATMAKFGGHAEAHEAELFWPEFKASGLTPEMFEQTLDRIAPLSFTFHGRPPTMREITELSVKQPHEARKYFEDLPDKHYPSVSAGNMVKALTSARPWAQEHLGREPLKNEAETLHHSGQSAQEFYAHLAAQDPDIKPKLPVDGLQTEVGGNPGDGSESAARGQPTRK